MVGLCKYALGRIGRRQEHPNLAKTSWLFVACGVV
jgi:hypothetical protein